MGSEDSNPGLEDQNLPCNASYTTPQRAQIDSDTRAPRSAAKGRPKDVRQLPRRKRIGEQRPRVGDGHEPSLRR